MTVLAYRVTQFGLPLVEGLCCSKCGEARWPATIVAEQTEGDPDARCGNCNQALKHGACVLDEDDRLFTMGEDAICWPCTDALRQQDDLVAERLRDDATDRRLDEARGK